MYSFVKLTIAACSCIYCMSFCILTQMVSPSYNPRHKSWSTCVIFPSPMLIWISSHFIAPKYARLNIGEGEGHIWVRAKVWRVNVRNIGENSRQMASFSMICDEYCSLLMKHFQQLSTNTVKPRTCIFPF